ARLPHDENDEAKIKPFFCVFGKLSTTRLQRPRAILGTLIFFPLLLQSSRPLKIAPPGGHLTSSLRGTPGGSKRYTRPWARAASLITTGGAGSLQMLPNHKNRSRTDTYLQRQVLSYTTKWLLRSSPRNYSFDDTNIKNRQNADVTVLKPPYLRQQRKAVKTGRKKAKSSSAIPFGSSNIHPRCRG
ncbi:unnamed protein product, partial [Ectocarpus sp. 12 AP-2014]